MLLSCRDLSEQWDYLVARPHEMERTLRDNEHVFQPVMLEPNGKREVDSSRTSYCDGRVWGFLSRGHSQGYPWFEAYNIVSIWCRGS
ncbi:hypothetical protein HanRHA438_Chr12g0570361 [Helianthus annuus]|nr:hypothetical protein HanIR_Chr12g0603341 [Helianthus annuus]KAJ0726878.1 hypothetical protein HanPI659440_Chr12g0475391 [Helianthus annuus]KAJ0868066.1 hypothetical protein HanRHA438_Chr12g0570361 [Helianthus annuus]